jgi:hypothetical protein
MGDSPNNRSDLMIEDNIHHVYEWLEEPSTDEGEKLAKEWLDKFTRPAYDKHKQGLNKWLAARELSCVWKGKRYRCTGASRMGDVWLQDEGSANFYDHRVDVTELSEWERKDPYTEPERPITALPAVGAARNAPCPCGSGVKLKKCCGSGAKQSAQSAQFAADKAAKHAAYLARKAEQSGKSIRGAGLMAIAALATMAGPYRGR